MYDLPGSVWALVLTGVIGIPATTSLMLYRGAEAAGLGRRAAAAVAAAAAAVLGGWIVASSLLARAGVYHRGIGLGLVAFVGVLLGLLAATRIPTVARILAAPGTPARLAVPHTLRVVGVLFLLVMALGKLPAVFALPAGLGDIAIGVAAPLVARRLARGGGHAMAVRFNLLGILDLAVAVTVAFLANLDSLAVTPSTEPLTLLPLALVATVAVPLAVALHIVSLRRLRTATPPPGGPGRTPIPERGLTQPHTPTAAAPQRKEAAMTADSTSSSQPRRPPTHTRRPGIARLLRVVLWLLAVSIFAQPVFAGLFLDGHNAWRDWHATNGMLLLPLLALIQVVLAVLAWRAGRGPGWLPLASAGLLLAIIIQNVLGMNDQLALHVPLGVAIFGLVATLLGRTRNLTRPSTHPPS